MNVVSGVSAQLAPRSPQPASSRKMTTKLGRRSPPAAAVTAKEWSRSRSSKWSRSRSSAGRAAAARGGDERCAMARCRCWMGDGDRIGSLDMVRGQSVEFKIDRSIRSGRGLPRWRVFASGTNRVQVTPPVVPPDGPPLTRSTRRRSSRRRRNGNWKKTQQQQRAQSKRVPYPQRCEVRKADLRSTSLQGCGCDPSCFHMRPGHQASIATHVPQPVAPGCFRTHARTHARATWTDSPATTPQHSHSTAPQPAPIQPGQWPKTRASRPPPPWRPHLKRLRRRPTIWRTAWTPRSTARLGKRWRSR